MPEKFMQCGFLFKTYILHRFYSAMVKKRFSLVSVYFALLGLPLQYPASVAISGAMSVLSILP